jgi:hypothetical protein
MEDRFKNLGAENRPLPGARRVQRPKGPYSAAEIALAGEIRSAYITSRSRWETSRRGVEYHYVVPKGYDAGSRAHRVDGVVMDGKDKPPIWITLAQKFLAQELDPQSYIAELFDSKLKGVPEPAQLFDARFLAQWREVSKGMERRLKVALRVQKQTALMQVLKQKDLGLSSVHAHAAVLLDEQLQLSALYRFCLAYELRKHDQLFRDIMRQFALPAAVQFRRARKPYQRAWGAWLPESFIKVSRKLYRQALAMSDDNQEWSYDHEG